MVKVEQISRMIALCNNAGQTGLSKDLNHIRGIALGKPFGDFAYECQQAIDSYPDYPKELVAEFNKIMYTEEAIKWCRENAPEAIKDLPDSELYDIMKDSYLNREGV